MHGLARVYETMRGHERAWEGLQEGARMCNVKHVPERVCKGM